MWKSKGTRIAKTILKKEQSWKTSTTRFQETVEQGNTALEKNRCKRQFYRRESR